MTFVGEIGEGGNGELSDFLPWKDLFSIQQMKISWRETGWNNVLFSKLT